MQNSEDIDEIMTKLENGETLMIDDQWRSYISIEGSDGPDRFVMRSIYASIEDHGKAIDAPLKYEEKRFKSLAEALLSLEGYKWVRR
ncbi:hypothetical protein [Reticulibacter mediterranei]|nr:hypothetical protein [Reticulibacter mediterranei]